RLEGIVVTAIARYQLRRAPASGPHADAVSFSRAEWRKGPSRMAGNPLLIRPFGAFEPVRLLSRPTDERPQEPQWDQKRKAASSHRRTPAPEPKRLLSARAPPSPPASVRRSARMSPSGRTCSVHDSPCQSYQRVSVVDAWRAVD